MSTFSSFFARPLRLLLPVIALIAGFGTPASAVAPKAPSNLTLITSLAMANGQSGTARHYLLRWNDNSLDETGFRVEVRFGNTGAFELIANLGPGSTQHVYSNGFPAGIFLQFRVLAFKYNGSKTEFSESNLVEYEVKSAAASLVAPTDFLVNLVNDGYLRFTWTDRSLNEYYHQLFYRKTVASGSTPNAFVPLAYFLFTDTPNVTLKHNLIPGQSYEFALRATASGQNTSTTPVDTIDSALVYSPVIPLPSLTDPTELTGTAVDQQQITLQWKDNSFNETGYQIEYKTVATGQEETPPQWTTFATVNPNTTSYTIGTGPGMTLEWRVKAVYEATGVTKILSNATNVATVTTQFTGPTGLTATTSGVSGAVDLAWQDLASTETNYDIYTRVTGTETWYYCQSMLADTTRATVTTRVEQDTDGNSTNVALAIDSEHDFVVEARYAGTGAVSDKTNVAKAFARHGFTSRTYHPAAVDVAFTYNLTVSNSGTKTSWSVNGLPAGLSFDETSGVISGTPQVSGVFSCPMSVSYSTGPTATTPLTLRILPKEAGPVVVNTIPSLTVGTATKFTIPLEGKFNDPDTQKAVKLRTTRGDVDLVMYQSLAPEAVNNFMGYVNSGAYNGVIFHRSVPNFIVQGGAYVPIEAPNYFSSLIKRPSPRNEPGISNVRGTVAAAKVGGNPDSATHDFFFNVEDNSLKANIELDNQNGGFTVFARVAGGGMGIVDGIEGLPIGVYKDYNTSGGTDATLDRRVILDGSKVAFEEVPMNVEGTTAPATMDVSKTVQILRASEIPVMGYEVENTNAAVIRTSVLSGNLVLEGLTAGTCTVKVRARDLDGYAAEQSFTVNVVKGHKAPAITKHPVSVAVLENAKASMTVTATGTSLTYQWRKNQVPIEGATAKTLNFASVKLGDVGSYDVLVGNSTTTLTSTAARLDLRALPDITGTLPAETVVELGDPLVLETTATGAPAPTFAWLKDGKAVAGQKLAKLNIPVTKLTDGGNYVLRATNVAGKEDSAAAPVIVIDKGAHLMATLPGKNVVLKAQVSGPSGLIYQWLRNGSLLNADTEQFIGTQTATLTIKGVSFLEAGDYTCRVWGPAEVPVDTGAWKVAVVTKPVLGTITPDYAYLGLAYDYTLPQGGSSNLSITSFTISGLPAGLKLEAATGRITGKATKSGTYPLKITAKNPAGSSAVASANLIVLPMPEAVVGSFIGQIGASNVFNGGQGGRVDMTVTDGGVISGKLTQGKSVLSFTGLMEQVPGSIRTSGKATITRKGLAPLQLVLTSLAPSGYTDSGNVSGTISDGENSVIFVAYRSIYNSTWNRNGYVGTFNTGLSVTDTAVGDESVPQGKGCMAVTINSGGGVSMSGRLADGTTLTASSFLGGQTQFFIHQSLYKNTGTLVGLAYLSLVKIKESTVATDPDEYFFRVDGDVLWSRAAQATASERSYKAGFIGLPVKVLGMTYTPPKGLDKIVMSLPNAQGNALLDFDQGGLDDAIIDPDVPALYINNANVASITAGVETNPGKVKLSIASGTGVFSGSFELSDPLAPKRTANFYGMVIPQIPTVPVNAFGSSNPSVEIPGVAANGVGYFTLAQLPSEGPPATTITTSKILSGSVRLSPTPITITTQPQSKSVDPGTNVTFTVVATAPGGTTTGLTYQWRKGGVSISGATSASYTINSVAESHEGSYDVVIETVYSRVISQAATLEINNPVSNVVVTRNPASNPLPVGGSVTFTATCQGSGPLTYRWRKNGTEINGDAATQATYTISNLTLDDAATYSVRVSNPLTPGGVVSGGNSMTVADPISAVTAQRTPSNEFIGYGGSVSFSVTNVAGSAGPYTYQWRKGGTDISGATASVYSINFVTGDHEGVYTVKVKNAATPDGVVSNEIPMSVSTGVSNVIASRTPSEASLPPGTAVTFSVSTQGAGPFSFQWKKGDVNIENATSASYTINAVTAADEANYTVLVSNASTPTGVLSNVVSLTVQQPITTVGITRTPNLSTFTTGDTVQFTANPNGTGPFVYRWYKDEIELPTATDSSLIINGLSEFDSGNYRVLVTSESSPGGVSSASVTISVVPP